MITSATARIALTFFVLLFLFSGAVGKLFVYATNPAWVSKAPMQEARSGLGVAVVNGKIYAIGGAGSTGFSCVNEEYDPVTDTWAFKAPMPTPRSAFGIAVYENKIYCIGGYAIINSLGTATAVNEVYDPVTDTWTNKASMPTARLNLRANAINGKIYLIGGIPTPDIGRTLNEVYDPASDTWTTKAPIPISVDLYASAVVDNKIFIMKSGLTQIYDAENDVWSTGAAPLMNSIIPCASTVTTSNSSVRIYLFGANATGSYWMLSAQGFTTQNYNPATGNWTLGTCMPAGRFDAGVAAVNDKLYVIGGYNYGARSGLSLNLPIIYSQVNEEYTPALDAIPLADKTPAKPTSDTPSPTLVIPTQSPATTSIQILSPTPTLNPTSTPSPNQTSSQLLSPSTSPTSNTDSIVEKVSASQFPTLQLLSSIVAIVVILVVVVMVAKKKHNCQQASAKNQIRNG
jgi:N-acetylneuraminic acid mutarotase